MELILGLVALVLWFTGTPSFFTILFCSSFFPLLYAEYPSHVTLRPVTGSDCRIHASCMESCAQKDGTLLLGACRFHVDRLHDVRADLFA